MHGKMLYRLSDGGPSHIIIPINGEICSDLTSFRDKNSYHKTELKESISPKKSICAMLTANLKLQHELQAFPLTSGAKQGHRIRNDDHSNQEKEMKMIQAEQEKVKLSFAENLML